MLFVALHTNAADVFFASHTGGNWSQGDLYDKDAYTTASGDWSSMNAISSSMPQAGDNLYIFSYATTGTDGNGKSIIALAGEVVTYPLEPFTVNNFTVDVSSSSTQTLRAAYSAPANPTPFALTVADTMTVASANSTLVIKGSSNASNNTFSLLDVGRLNITGKELSIENNVEEVRIGVSKSGSVYSAKAGSAGTNDTKFTMGFSLDSAVPLNVYMGNYANKGTITVYGGTLNVVGETTNTGLIVLDGTRTGGDMKSLGSGKIINSDGTKGGTITFSGSAITDTLTIINTNGDQAGIINFSGATIAETAHLSITGGSNNLTSGSILGRVDFTNVSITLNNNIIKAGSTINVIDSGLFMYNGSALVSGNVNYLRSKFHMEGNAKIASTSVVLIKDSTTSSISGGVIEGKLLLDNATLKGIDWNTSNFTIDGGIIELKNSAKLIMETGSLTIGANGANFVFDLSSNSFISFADESLLLGDIFATDFTFLNADVLGANLYRMFVFEDGIAQSSVLALNGVSITFKDGEIDYEGTFSVTGGELFIGLTIIPEPSTVALIMAILGLGFAIIRRKRS